MGLKIINSCDFHEHHILNYVQTFTKHQKFKLFTSFPIKSTILQWSIDWISWGPHQCSFVPSSWDKTTTSGTKVHRGTKVQPQGTKVQPRGTKVRWGTFVPRGRDKSTWNFAKGTDKSSLFDDSQTRADSLMFQSAKVSLYYACKFHQARLYPEYKVSPRLPFTLVLLPMIMQGNTKKIRKKYRERQTNLFWS